VILDLLMPDIGGIEVLRRLRKAASTEALPILVYTSKNLSESERTEIETMNSVIVRKDDVSTKLSARPFLDWLASAGLAPQSLAHEQNV